MSTESVKFLINARDNTGPATKKAESGFKRLKSSAASIAGGVIGANVLMRAMGGLTTAIKSTIGAYIEMELVQTRLTASLELNGENVESQLPTMNAWANEMQRVLNVSDETANSLAILAQQQGLSADASRDAVEAAIGLSQAHAIDQKTALKGVSLALEGNFSALERYIPSLRSAKDENEKMALVLKSANKGIKMQEESTHTLGGSWQAFQNTIGDTMEEIGSVVGPTLTDMVNGFKFVLQNWNDISQLIGLKATLFFVQAGNEIAHQFTVVAPAYIKWFGENFTGIMDNAFSYAENLVENWTTTVSQSILSLATFISNGFDFEQLTRELSAQAASNALAGFKTELGELPEIAEREMGAFEKVLGEDAERIEKNLSRAWKNIFEFSAKDAIPTVGEELQKEFDKNLAKNKDKNAIAKIGVNAAVESRLLTRGTGTDPAASTAENTKKTAEKINDLNTTLSGLLGTVNEQLAKIANLKQPQIVEAP